ncbi:RHS repeat domain-containing protein [Arcobacter sp. LA11]|uniref:RHS repeat domain-containing protein n=1 Tax=Arcobacter sp. LA11 TaxID=1898176 RepID=UPI001160B2F4|nr:RHS repeat domain-containing protein [Arcobacter sp. LA11]
MKRIFFNGIIKLVFMSIFFCMALNASKYEIHSLKECNSKNIRQEILGIKPLCINNEEIIRKDLLDLYGGNNVLYKTRDNSFTSIKSYYESESNPELWEITDDSSLVITYDKNNKYKIVKVKDSTTTINIPYINSEIDFSYEKISDNVRISQIIVNENIYGIDYDQNGIAKINLLSNAKNLGDYITYSYVFNDKGEVLRETISGFNIESRIKKYEYSIEGNNKVIKTVNPFGDIEIKKFNTNGRIVSLTDYNKLITTWEYDSNDRLIKENKPNNTVTSYEYSTSNLVDNSTLKVIKTSIGKPTVTKYYDSSNRKIKIEKQGFNRRIIVEDIVYDSVGRIDKYSIPYFKGEAVYFIDFTYDNDNRVTSIDKPGLNNTRLVTTYQYLNNNITIKYPDGKEEVVDSNKINSNETVTYDLLGNIVKIVDEKGNVLNFKYDILDRLIEKEIIPSNNEENKQVTNFVYDRADMGIGKLAYIKSKEYKKEYYYDELSRVKTNKTFIGNKSFITQYTYILDDKIETVIKPDGFKIINEYNDSGFLTAVKSPKLITVELDFENLKELIMSNLNDEYEINSKYYDLKAQIEYYSLKKPIYENLAIQYSSINVEIATQLNEVVLLLSETITLLQNNLVTYKSIADNLRNIRTNHLLPKLSEQNNEDNFKWLSEIFEGESNNYVALSTKYIDKASSLLEGVISDPDILNSSLNIDSDLITYYTNQSKEVNIIADDFSTLALTYSQRYEELKLGEGIFSNSTYLGMFDNTDYKYFYKIIDMDSLGRITNEVFGNGLVSKKEYDASSGNLIRITTGFNGNSDIKDIRYTYDVYNNLITQYDVKNNLTKNYVYDLSNKLISASSIGEGFYSNIAYIYIDPTTSSYQYDENTNTFTNSHENITLDLDNPNLISKNLNESVILYSNDSKTYKKTITENNLNNIIYKVETGFKYELLNDGTKYKNLIYANDKLIAIHIEEDMDDYIIPNNYYLHQDLFGSVDIITNELAVVEDKLNYRPFGEKTDDSWTQEVANNTITNISFKGYESGEFNLLNVDGYLYDPKIAKTFTNQPFSSLDEKTKDFFFYSNPTRYVDKELDSWFKNITDIFNIENIISVSSNTLLNTEVSRDIHSILSQENVYIGYEKPTDTNKIWYEPNSSGGLDIKVSDGGNSWNSVGTTGSLNSAGEITVDSLVLLNKMPCFYQDHGFIETGSKKLAYTCSTSQTWELGGDFDGTYTVQDLGIIYINALENSTIKVTAPSGEFSGIKEFKKVAGYWIDEDRKFIISDDVNKMSNISMNEGAKAFIKKDNSSIYSLARLYVPSISTKWVYLTSGYNLVATQFDLINSSIGGYVYDSKNNKYFKQTNNVWTSTDGLVQLSSHSSGRNIFTSLNANTKYYLYTNDCTSSTCYGSSSNNYFAGSKEDNMYVFDYVSAGNNKNNLADATHHLNIEAVYNSGDNGALVGNDIYVKRFDTLGRVVYYKSTDGYYYTKNGVLIPNVLAPRYGTVVSLPPGYDASTVIFSGNDILLANRTEATNWITAPADAGIKIGGVNYVHKVSSGKDFWTNNGSGDGQANATEIFTRGSRSMLPTVTHSLTAITKEVGTEANYTTTGLSATVDSSFKQWFYATSGTRTSNLLDAVLITSNPYRTSNSLANTVGYAMWGSNLMYKSGIVWKYSSNNANYNPCVAPYNDGTNYSNLTCKENYTYDSGWTHQDRYTYASDSGSDESGANGLSIYWAKKYIGSSSGVYNGGYIYSVGSFIKDIACCGSWDKQYYVKRTQARTRYKNFKDY